MRTDKVRIVKSKFSTFVKNAGLYFASSLFVAIVGVILNPLLAMNLSQEDYAILGYYSSFNFLLTPLLHFCTLTYYSRQYFFLPEEKRDVLGDTILLTMNMIGLISLIVFTFVFYMIHKRMGGQIPFIPYAVLTFIQTYVVNNVTFYLTKMRIQRKAKTYASFSIIQCLVTNALVILFVVYYKYGALGKLYAMLISTVLFAMVAFHKSLIKWRIDTTMLKSALKFGMPLTISALLWYCLSGIDRFFLGQIGDIGQLGVYNVAVSIAAYMQIFYTTLSNTFEPDIYQAIAIGNRRRTLAIVMTIIGIVIIFNAFFIAFAPLLIRILTAGRYMSSVPYTRILALSNISMACYYMVVRLIVGMGYVKGELMVRIVGAFMSVLIFWLLIKYYTFNGAAWGQVISFALLSLIGLIYLKIRKIKIKVQ